MMMVAMLLATGITIMAMAMAIANLAAKSKWTPAWIVTSVLSLGTVMATGYLVVTATPHQEVANSEPQNLSKDSSSGFANQTASLTDTSSVTDEKKQGESGADFSSNSNDLESVLYLEEILQALKDGKPVPEHYLDMLSTEDRQKVQKASQFGSDTTVNNPFTFNRQAVQNLIATHQSQGAPKKASTSTKSSSSSNAQNNPQTSDTSVPSAPQKAPEASTGGTLSDNSVLKTTLSKTQDSVRAYFRSVYAQPLQQSDSKDVFLAGTQLIEAHYQSGTCNQITIQYEKLTPAGKSHDEWEDTFRSRIGASKVEPTARAGDIATWSNVYPGVSVLQFQVDVKQNRGYILAR